MLRASVGTEACSGALPFADAEKEGWPEGSQELPGGPLIRSTSQLGLWIFLATVTMLFAAFTSAYLVRRAVSDWRPVSLPALLWFNTAVLLSSSVTMERGRREGKRPQSRRAAVWLWITALLGLVFLLGQLFSWHRLAAQGVFLPSNPHSSFFYILTGLHGLHLSAGLLLLLYLLFRVRRDRNSGGVPPQRNLTDLCATYWHFMGGLWLYLIVMLSMG